MHISKLKIKNFKCFDEVEINFDPNFNLIIGENNSGKSTILDALRLWQLAFQKFLKDRTNNQQSSFYASQYFSFTIDDISFLRIIEFNNLFKNKGQKDKQFEITVTAVSGTNFVNLPIIFSKTTEGQVLRFELCKQTKDRQTTSQYLSIVSNKPLGSDFKEIFLFTYINPIFHLPTKEPQFSRGYIINKLHEAKANEIIRNLIFLISPERKRRKREEKHEKLKYIENSLIDILKIDDISFSNRLEDEESYIKIYCKNESKNIEVEINQLGSGSINVLNILSVLAYGDKEKFKLNALLLDEPDSHLHFNHQSRLYKHLEKVSIEENKQIFIITHNSSLISQFDKLLFIKNGEKTINPLSLNDYLENHLKSIDENHYNVIKELSDAKYKLLCIEESIKEDNKTCFLFEGPTDRKIFKIAYKKLYNDEFPFEIIDKVSGASSITTTLNGNNKKLGVLIAIYDNDHEGRTQYNNLNSYIFSEQDDYKKAGNKFAFLLPIPTFRDIPFYKKHLTVEYLFNNEDLLKMLGVDNFIQEVGEEYKKIKGDDKKQAYVITENVKNIISENCGNLSKESFVSFVPLFEKIAEIINYELPNVDFNA